MKAIIVGAGRGARLMPYTEEQPKCLVDGLGGRRLLDWILEALRGAGLADIVFVGGYQLDRIRQAFPALQFVENADWERNNVLQSLFFAEPHFDAGFVVSYADVVYQTHVVQRLMSAEADVALVVDRDWRKRYPGRDAHPEDQAEKVVSQDGVVRQVGKYLPAERADGEFIGLARFSARAVEAMRRVYRRSLTDGPNRPFGHAATLRDAYLPDMLEALIGEGVQVRAVEIWGDWVEIDTPQDLAFARELLADGTADALTRAFWATRAQHYQELEWAQRDDYLGSVVRSCDLQPAHRVLDVGAGTGIVSHAIAPHVAEVVGIDVSPDMLAQARATSRPNERFEEEDVRRLRYPAEHFDRVVARMVFHHVMPDPVEGLRECLRVLRPGGLMVLSEGTPPDACVRDWYATMFALKEERLTFLEEDLRQLMARAGFELAGVTRHVMRQVSIQNWLRSSGLPEETQRRIFQMHLDLDARGKEVYHMRVTPADVLCDFTFVNVIGRRPAGA